MGSSSCASWALPILPVRWQARRELLALRHGPCPPQHLAKPLADGLGAVMPLSISRALPTR